MARRVFFSFHYMPDNWQASQIRNIGAIEGNKAASDNDWESVTKGGDAAIKKWIHDQMSGRSCVIVLIGTDTAGRKWIKYEIEKAWEASQGVLGIYVHNLQPSDHKQSTKGKNPFEDFTMQQNGKNFSSIVKVYDPPYSKSTDVYEHIEQNIADWIDEAVNIRQNYKTM